MIYYSPKKIEDCPNHESVVGSRACPCYVRDVLGLERNSNTEHTKRTRSESINANVIDRSSEASRKRAKGMREFFVFGI